MSRPATAPDRLILMGVFGAPQGVRGEIRVKSLTRDPKAIGAYGALTDGKRARAFAFESLRPLKDDMLVARVAGVPTREAAAALTGVEIFARRDQLPPPSDDEFYYDDLVGLDAVDARRRAAWPGRGAHRISARATSSKSRRRAAAKRCCCRSPSGSPRRSISTPGGS